METLQKQTSQNGEERSTYLPGDFRASLLALPEIEREKTITVTSGRKITAQYERQDRLGMLVKMLLESSAWYNPAVRLKWKVRPLYLKKVTKKRYLNKNTPSKLSVEILSQKDIPSNRSLFQLVPSERTIGETGFGLLPTVQAQGLKVCNPMGKTEFMKLELLPTPTAMIPGDINMNKLDERRERIKKSKKNGNGFGPTLNELAKKGLLPTPVASNQKNGHRKLSSRIDRKIGQGWTVELNDLATLGMLPTPTTSMVTMEDFIQAKFHSSKRPVYSKIGPTGEVSQLNPLFVAEMMGFPPYWTLLPYLTEEIQDSLLKLTENGEKNQ